MRRDTFTVRASLVLALFAALGILATAPARSSDRECEIGYSIDFPLEDCSFSARGSNRYFSLEPGYRLVLEGEDEGELIRVVITVLPETMKIRFRDGDRRRKVRTRVIEEREFVDGELYEISRNFYARCRETNDVYYFGEDVEFYEDGEVVGTGGTWRVGVDGALPGIIMPGSFLLGSRYFQEVAPGALLDRAENVATGIAVETPIGALEDCVLVFEDSALEPDADSEKAYCPGIGLVQDDELQLVSYGFIGDDESDDESSDESSDSSSH